MPPARRSLWDRISSKIRFPDDLDDCWIWTGAYSTKRRGQIRPVIAEGGRGGRTLNVARVICEWFHGPSGLEAGHTCPVRENCRCVNPRHLRWMTRTENERSKCRTTTPTNGSSAPPESAPERESASI